MRNLVAEAMPWKLLMEYVVSSIDLKITFFVPKFLKLPLLLEIILFTDLCILLVIYCVIYCVIY